MNWGTQYLGEISIKVRNLFIREKIKINPIFGSFVWFDSQFEPKSCADNYAFHLYFDFSICTEKLFVFSCQFVSRFLTSGNTTGDVKGLWDEYNCVFLIPSFAKAEQWKRGSLNTWLHYELPAWGYSNPIVAENNTEIMAPLVEFLKSSFHDCEVIITSGILFHCKSQMSLFLLANAIIFSSCFFIHQSTSQPDQSLCLLTQSWDWWIQAKSEHEANICFVFTVVCYVCKPH